MTTWVDMVQAGRDAVALNVKYIYGAKPVDRKFRVYTLDEIEVLRHEYGSMVWDSDDWKAGHLCCDCSGLISKATGTIIGSYYLRQDAMEEADVSELYDAADNWGAWEHYIGWVLWMPGHVGIVSDVPGMYYAMDGSARNAVHNPLWMQDWQIAFPCFGVSYRREVGNMEFIGRATKGEPLRYFCGMSVKEIPEQEDSEAIQEAFRKSEGRGIAMLEGPFVKRYEEFLKR